MAGQQHPCGWHLQRRAGQQETRSTWHGVHHLPNEAESEKMWEMDNQNNKLKNTILSFVMIYKIRNGWTPIFHQNNGLSSMVDKRNDLQPLIMNGQTSNKSTFINLKVDHALTMVE